MGVVWNIERRPIDFPARAKEKAAQPQRVTYMKNIFPNRKVFMGGQESYQVIVQAGVAGGTSLNVKQKAAVGAIPNELRFKSRCLPVVSIGVARVDLLRIHNAARQRRGIVYLHLPPFPGRQGDWKFELIRLAVAIQVVSLRWHNGYRIC